MGHEGFHLPNKSMSSVVRCICFLFVILCFYHAQCNILIQEKGAGDGRIDFVWERAQSRFEVENQVSPAGIRPSAMYVTRYQPVDCGHLIYILCSIEGSDGFKSQG